ncbi:MAG TPA: AMP-binding protein [Chloroflexota bacterium]|nr:AMP-binding protein [Chloroflexota bacterium]HUM67960.1 AMP-binding protein [Chloroflexota bacterium]
MLTLTTRPSFHTLLDARALTAVDATRPAIIYLQTDSQPEIISRQMFRLAATGYANGLRRLGIQPGELVIIAHTQNLESIYAFWGALLVGAIPSMFPTLTDKLDADIYMQHMAELVRLSDVKAVLTTDEFAPQLGTAVTCPVFGSSAIRDWETERLRDAQSPHLPVSQSPDSIAFLQHSSGTTGLQKGVALAHTAVLNQLASYSDALHLTEQDVIVSWLPLYHDMGLIAGFLLPLVQGIPLVLMSPFDWVSHPALLLRAIHDYQGTLCWLPNFAYNHCARRIRARDKEGLSLASMRLFINCSEPVRYDSHQLFLNAFAANGLRPEMLGVSYAMAENTFAVTQTVPGRTAVLDTIDEQSLIHNQYAQPVAADHPQAAVKVSCGPVIAGTEVAVWDGDGRALTDRRVGEIVIRSNCMLTEYYRRPDLRPFLDGWYKTGDRGYMVDGELLVIGRAKELIINAGKNIYPQDIEAIVNDVPGVHPGRAVCFGVPDEKEGTELIAVVAEVKTADPAERKEINKTIRQEVARQSGVSVSYVHLVGRHWLLKTSSGKIARAANREKWQAETDN